MTEYTPRQYADAAMFLVSDVELSNADRGTLARMMRAAIAAGFNPVASLETQWAHMVMDAGSEASEDEERRARAILRVVR